MGASLIVASFLAGREGSAPDQVDRPAPARKRLLLAGGLLVAAEWTR